MLHRIPPNAAGPLTPEMSRAVEACVHCGFCLPACPTYAVMGEEMNSPRGRIFLMKETLEGRLAPADTAPYVDLCLGCLACETACPSGVKYGELLTPYRWAERSASPPAEAAVPSRGAGRPMRSLFSRLRRKALMATLPYPGRFRAAMMLGRAARPVRRLMPKGLRGMFDLIPAHLPKRQPLAAFYAAEGTRRGRVALLAGCAQQVLAPEINAATIRVLTRNGVDVLIPPAQACCGALAMHLGEVEAARGTARRNLAAFPSDVDAVLTNAAGCGSGLHEYALLFKGEPEEAAATAFAHRCQDVSVYLERLGVLPPPALPRAVKIVYHDACHLAHAQRVRAEPRRLLKAIPGVELLEPAEADLCCGSAGTYNLEHPEIAAQLGERKARNLLATGAEVIATGNIGCLSQIAAYVPALPRPVTLLHPMMILDQAYRGNFGA